MFKRRGGFAALPSEATGRVWGVTGRSYVPSCNTSCRSISIILRCESTNSASSFDKRGQGRIFSRAFTGRAVTRNSLLPAGTAFNRSANRLFKTSRIVLRKDPVKPTTIPQIKSSYEIPESGILLYQDSTRKTFFYGLVGLTVVNFAIWSVYMVLQTDVMNAAQQKGEDVGSGPYLTFALSIVCAIAFPLAVIYFARHAVKELRLLAAPEGPSNVGSVLRLTPYSVFGGKGRSWTFPIEHIEDVAKDAAFQKLKVKNHTFRYLMHVQGEIVNKDALTASLTKKKVVFQ